MTTRLTRETAQPGEVVMVREIATGNEWIGSLTGWDRTAVEIAPNTRSRKAHNTTWKRIRFHHAAVEVYAIH